MKHRLRAGAFAVAGLLVAGTMVKLCVSSAPGVASGKRVTTLRERPPNALQSAWIRSPDRDSTREPSIEKRVEAEELSFRSDLAAALRGLQEEADPVRRAQRMSNLLDQIAAGDVRSALIFLDGQPKNGAMHELLICLLRRWAGSDPRAAAVASMELGAATQLDAIASVLPLWAQKDVDGALAWVKDLPEGELKSGAQIAMAYETARTKPAMALDLAMALPASPESDQVLSYIAMQWAATEPRDAASWASQLEEQALRERLLAMIATVWGGADPVSAGNLAVESIPAGRAQEDALVGIVERWVQTDPTTAAAWVAQFPQGDLRTAAMENITSQWGQSDYIKTGAWLNTLPRDASWDAAVGVYASGLGASHRDLALSWAGSIQDASLRGTVLNRFSNH